MMMNDKMEVMAICNWRREGERRAGELTGMKERKREMNKMIEFYGKYKSVKFWKNCKMGHINRGASFMVKWYTES